MASGTTSTPNDRDEEESGTGSTARTRKPGFIESMMPGGLGDILSWGFWGLIFAGILYAVVRFIPGAQDLVGQILPTSWQAWLNDKLGDEFFPNAALEMLNLPEAELAKTLKDYANVSEENSLPLAKLIQSNKERLVKIVKDANGGRFTLSALRSQATMEAMLIQAPDLAGQIAALMPAATGAASTAGAAAGASGQPAPAADTPALAAARAVLGNPQKLTLMLAPDKFDSTMVLIATNSPIKVSPEALGKFVRAVGMQGNTPTPQFAAFLQQALDPKPETRAAAMQSFVIPLLGQPQSRAAVRELILSIQPADLQGNALLSGMRNMAENERNFNALAGLIQRTETGIPGKLMQLCSLAATDQAAACQLLDQTPILVDELKRFKQESDWNNVPADMRQLIDLAADPKTRTQLAAAATVLAEANINVAAAAANPQAIIAGVADGSIPASVLRDLAAKSPDLLPKAAGVDLPAIIKGTGTNDGLLRHIVGSYMRLNAAQIDLGEMMDAMKGPGGKVTPAKAMEFFQNPQTKFTDRQLTDLGMMVYAYSLDPKTPAADKPMLQFLTLNNNPKQPFANLQAMYDFAKALPATPDNNLVMGGFLNLMSGNKATLQALPTYKIKAFLRNEANYKALTALMNALDPNGFPESNPARHQLQVLKENWAGFAAVLRSDDGGADKVLAGLKGVGQSGDRHTENEIFWGAWLPGGLFSKDLAVPQSIYTNRHAVIEVQDAFLPPAPTTTPTRSPVTPTPGWKV